MRNCLGTSELSTTRDRVGLNLTLSQEQLAEGESSMGFAEVFVTVLIEQKPVCALTFPASGRLESRSTLISALRRVASSVFHWRGAHVHRGGACWVGGIPVGWGPAGPWGGSCRRVAAGLPSPWVGPGDAVVSSSSAWGQRRQLLKAGSCLSNDNSLVQRMPFFLCPSPGEDSISGRSCLPV